MIRYDLRCLSAGHAFDGWFRSSDDFDAQAARGLLACPICGADDIRKALMTPLVANRAGDAHDLSGPIAPLETAQPKLREMMRTIHREITRNSEDVGDRFPEVARKMHAEEIEQRTVHGRATVDDVKALADEGVPVQALPTFPDEMN